MPQNLECRTSWLEIKEVWKTFGLDIPTLNVKHSFLEEKNN